MKIATKIRAVALLLVSALLVAASLMVWFGVGYAEPQEFTAAEKPVPLLEAPLDP